MLTEKRYQEIRRKVKEAELLRSATEVMTAPGEKSFASVDELFVHLDALVEQSENQPARTR
jgi:hypothetical protein